MVDDTDSIRDGSTKGGGLETDKEDGQNWAIASVKIWQDIQLENVRECYWRKLGDKLQSEVLRY